MRSRVQCLAWLLACCSLACAGSRIPITRAEVPETVPTLDFLGDFNIPPGASIADWPAGTIGGISAITFDERSGNWLALSDAKNACRFFEIEIEWDTEGLRVQPLRIVYLTQPDGDPFVKGLDPEGLVIEPNGDLVVAVEGHLLREPIDEPRILGFSRAGRLQDIFEIPDKFNVGSLPPRKGVRENKAFESLTITPDGGTIYTASESALTQDGKPSDFAQGTMARIVEFVRSSGGRKPAREFVYPLEKLKPVLGYRHVAGVHGLVELLALSPTRLLAMERGFVKEVGGRGRSRAQVRIFLVDLEGATDVSSFDSLDEALAAGSDVTPVAKHLVLDLDEVVESFSSRYRRLDNFEAMGLGPELPDGGRSLILVSDDNFSPLQRTAFLMFRLTLPPLSTASIENE